MIVLPGRSGTGGFNPANAITSTPRDLTIDDAAALRRAPSILEVAPLTMGTSEISYGGRLRETLVAGATAEIKTIRRYEMASGSFLPADDWNRAAPVAVIGATIREEIFGNREAVGQIVRIGDCRVRVVGVLKAAGMGMGHEHRRGRICAGGARAGAVQLEHPVPHPDRGARPRKHPRAKQDALEILVQRHDGEKDVTVVTQDADARR